MTIRKRLALSFFSILALFGLNLVFYSWSNSRRTETVEAVRRAVSRQLALASLGQGVKDLRTQVGLLDTGAAGGSSAAKPEEVGRFAAEVNATGEEIAQLVELSDLVARPRMEAFQNKYKEFGLASVAYYRNLGVNQPQAIKILATQVEPAGDEVVREIPELQKAEKARVESARRTYEQVARLTDRVSVFLFLASAFLAVAVAYLLSRYISLRVGDLEQGAAAIGAGNLAERIPVHSKDELGHLAESFNSMAQNLQAARERLEEANRDLKERDLELSQINDQLVESEQRAQEANTAKSEFLANMSHELRTPLNAVIGYSEMLQEEAEDLGQEEFIPDLQKIHAAGKHLLALINDILDLSKVEAGKMTLFLEDFNVAEAVTGVVTTVQPLVKKNNNTLEVICSDDLGTLRADLTKVRQALFNLLSNACKFTENGTITLEVQRQEVGGEDCVLFKVSDTGIGMTPEQMKKLFKAFSQADASTTRKYGGTGLGLVITRSFCQMMGGDVDVTSEYGKGTTFTIRLPAVMAEAASQQQDAPPAASEVATPTGKANTLLAIDDDPSMHDLMRRLLSHEGFEVVTCASGPEGIRLAKELRPAAITLDVMMPGMDGWAVLSQLKADPELADIPVIMLTMVQDRSIGFALGVSDYLTKPIERERLLEVLSKYRRDPRDCPVLVVEDDETTRQMLRRHLEHEGWYVNEAANGREALEQVRAHEPCLILLDLMMPEMDGFHFIDELRAHERWRSIPVVVVTAKDLSAAERGKLKDQVERVLQKGAYSREELLREIKGLAVSQAGRAEQPA
jgi:signal transduction histidine kinase/CheY-like chemotaxis protein